MPRALAPRLLLAGVLLHLALYGRGLTGGFTFDDRKIVLEHPAVSGRAPLVGTLTREYFEKARPEQGLAYRPLTLLSLGLDTRLFGLSPGAMRLENLLLAGLGAGLFAGLLAALGAPDGIVWAALVLLSCHPVRSEAILSVVGRSELLVFALVSGALLTALRALRGSAVAAASSGLLFALALFAKENAFAAPALLLLLFLAAPAVRAAADRRGAALLAGGWTLALLAALAARRLVLGGFLTGPLARMSPFDNSLAGFSPGERAAAALSLLPLAATRLLFPRTLAADYGSTSFPRSVLLAPAAVAAGAVLVVLASLLAVALIARRNGNGSSLAGLGLGWALAAYLPFANVLFPTGTAFAERLLFLPAAGVALAAATALALLPRRAAVGACMVAALAGTARIERRIPEWKDDRALFSATVRDVPQNGRAWFDLALISLSAREAARAGRELEEALRCDARLVPSARELLGNALRIGDADAERAIRGALARASQ